MAAVNTMSMASVQAIILLLLLTVSTATLAATTVTTEDYGKQPPVTTATAKRLSTKRPSTKLPCKRLPSISPTKSPTTSPTTPSTNAGNDIREQVWATNKAKWDTFISAGGNPPLHEGYEMIYQRIVMVLDYSRPFRVTVSKDDKVVEVKKMDGTPVTDPIIIGQIRTVDQAFILIKDAWLHAATVTATYDTDKGYPTYVYIDESPEIVDEEIEFFIKNVTLCS